MAVSAYMERAEKSVAVRGNRSWAVCLQSLTAARITPRDTRLQADKKALTKR